MVCKYCKSQNHFIDTCPDIICRLCKQYGHPHWKCKDKQQPTSQENKQQNKNSSNKNSFNKTTLNKNSTYKNRSKSKYNNKQSSPRIVDNQHQSIKDYYQYMDKPWSEIC